MSQHSEDRVAADNLSAPMEPRLSTARILPFERPQSELQKAVQLRAHENMALSRERHNHRPPLTRWFIGILGAVLPVLVLIVGLDGFLRVFHRITDMYAKMPVSAPAVVPAVPDQSQPGLVMLKPMDSTERPASQPSAPPEK